MSDELKAINLSQEDNEVKGQQLRSPLAGQLPAAPKNRPPPVIKDPQKSQPPPQEHSEGYDANELMSSVGRLKFREEKKDRTLAILCLGILILLVASFGSLWILAPHALKQAQAFLLVQYYRTQEKSLSLIDVIEGKKPGQRSKQKADQHAKLRGIIQQANPGDSDSALADFDCIGETSQASLRSNKTALSTIDCYLFHDMPSKALPLNENIVKNPDKGEHEDPTLSSIINVQVKYRLWYPPSIFKSIRADCNRWEAKQICIPRVILDGYYYKSAFAPEKGFQLTKDLTDVSPAVGTYLWLSGGRIAMFEGRYSVAEERLLKAEKLAPSELLGLRREIAEIRAVNAYYGHNKTLLKQILDGSHSAFFASSKSGVSKIEFLQGMITAKDENQKRNLLIKTLARLQTAEIMPFDPWFFHVISIEANMNGAQEPYIPFLSRLKQVYNTQNDARHHVNKLIDQWSIRTALSAKQYSAVKISLQKYQKEYESDVFYTHFSIANQVRSSIQTNSSMPITSEMQLALSQKEKLPWQTQYILGFALTRSAKLAEMPSLISSFENEATTVDAKMFSFLMQVEYLIAQKKYEVAEKNLETFLAKYPDFLAALVMQSTLLHKLGKDKKIPDVKFKIDAVQNSDKYRDYLRVDPLSPFALMEMNRDGVTDLH